MTQPNLPTAAAQQQAAVEVFAQYEPPLYEAYLEMMLEWLAAVRTAMFAGGVAKLGLIPDPLSVFAKTPMWNDLTDKYSEEVAREVLAKPYANLFADGTLFESRPFVRNWIAARANRLQNVPNEVFGLVQHVIDSGTTNGASIPDVTKQVQELFDAADVQTWKNRARTVARTEVVGAYNGGLYDAFSMVVEADPETTWVKRWLATEDHRTRPDHREADGQAVPWGQPFTVGGFSMMYPHDPEAPPQEVISCRCTMLLEVAGEPTDMSNRGYRALSAAVFGFNPLEKRDKDGKWTKGGLLKSLVKGGKAEAKDAESGKDALKLPEGAGPIPTSKGVEHYHLRNKDPRYQVAARGDNAIGQFPHMVDKPFDQKMALKEYADEGYALLNKNLGSGTAAAGSAKKLMSDLDAATAYEPRKRDALLWRGMRNAHLKFPDAWNGDMTGLEWTQKGFSSTSAKHGVAASFTKYRAGEKPEGGVVMRILLPKEVKVGGVNMTSTGNVNWGEQEALLGRNVRYRVTADHGFDDTGRRMLDVEVIR